MTHPTRLALILASVFTAATASAQVSYGTAGGTYTQNFDWTTGGNGTAVTWVDNSATQSYATWVSGASSLGWYSGFTGTDTFNGTNGNTNTGASVLSNFFFGSADTDRSLGGRPTSGAGPLILGLRLTNNTGVTLTSFSLSYALEVTATRDATTPTLTNTATFGYFLGTPAAWDTAGFTAASALNATTPTVAGTALGTVNNVNGNLAENRTSVSSTVTGLNWTNGSDLWLRWTVPNVANGPNVGLDDLSFSAVSAVPEPASFAVLAGFATLGFAASRRRRA